MSNLWYSVFVLSFAVVILFAITYSLQDSIRNLDGWDDQSRDRHRRLEAEIDNLESRLNAVSLRHASGIGSLGGSVAEIADRLEALEDWAGLFPRPFDPDHEGE